MDTLVDMYAEKNPHSLAVRRVLVSGLVINTYKTRRGPHKGLFGIIRKDHPKLDEEWKECNDEYVKLLGGVEDEKSKDK
jgi:hypothetical protein